MNDNVIPLARTRAASTNIRCPQCGGEWWNIVRDVGNGRGPFQVTGAVILTPSPAGDRIAGYSGRFVCRECGSRR